MKSRSERIVEWWKDNKNKSLRDAGEEFDLSYERIRQILNNEDVDVTKYSPKRYRDLTEDDLQEAVKPFLKNNKMIPTKQEWDQYVRSDDIPPADNLVGSYGSFQYGSWDDFIIDLVMPHHSHCECRDRRSKYSYNDLVTSLLDLTDNLGRAPTYNEINDCEHLPSWVDVYSRVGRLSHLWEKFGIDYKFSGRSKVQEFTYSNNDIMEFLVKGYEKVGRDLSPATFKRGNPMGDTPIVPNTLRRRLFGCNYSIINLVERYKDFYQDINWDKSKYFQYHFNGSDSVNDDIFDGFIDKQPEIEQPE